jgi:hypothetical protein
MKKITEFWRYFAICYAIGYMLFLRPVINSGTVDIIFYLSLLVFSTLAWIYRKKQIQQKNGPAI